MLRFYDFFINKIIKYFTKYVFRRRWDTQGDNIFYNPYAMMVVIVSGDICCEYVNNVMLLVFN